MTASIFISYASQDAKVANTLCKALESRGFGCWIASRDIAPGENFQIAIVRAIRTAKLMLLVFTGNSNNSDEMAKELALASQSKLIVVPLRIDDVKPNDAFAYEFATRQWIDFFADWETAIEQLASRIATALGVEATPVHAPSHAAPPQVAPPPPQPAPTPGAVAAALATPGVLEAASQPVGQTMLTSPAPATADSGPSSFAPAAKAKGGAPVALFITLGVLAVALIGAAVVVLPSFLARKPTPPAAITNAVSAPPPSPVVAVAPTTGYTAPQAGAAAVGPPPPPPMPASSTPPYASGGPPPTPPEEVNTDPEAQQHARPTRHHGGGASSGGDSGGGGSPEVPF